jgi:hypothetical protein
MQAWAGAEQTIGRCVRSHAVRVLASCFLLAAGCLAAIVDGDSCG